MAWIVLTIALAAPPPPQPVPTWRLVDTPNLHVGARPAADVGRDWWAAGVTVQVTTRAL